VSTPPVPPADRGVPPHPGASPRRADESEHDPTGIRALLSALPDLVARISASIAKEQSAREGATVVPLRRRGWGWQHLGAAAAAAVVLAVGVPALLTGTGPGDVMASLKGSSAANGASSAAAGGSESLSDASSPPAAKGGTVAPRSQPSSPGDQRVQVTVGGVALAATGTAYTSAGLATQAVTLGTTFEASSAAKDSTVPDGEAGLRACLTALGVEAWLPIRGDVATLDGAPAVIALVDRGPTQTVYAVSPDCDAQHPTMLAGPLTLP